MHDPCFIARKASRLPQINVLITFLDERGSKRKPNHEKYTFDLALGLIAREKQP